MSFHLLMTAKSRLVVFLRETGIFLVFCALTALVTWPYVSRLRDVVVDEGDPYLMSWILWWDYHQTFTNPLQLFHSNTFYPYPYSLAFSEHSYGIALPFFPLFAAGLRPLTVHAVAMFFGFALCGYGAFRLGRTLTGSYTVAWVAGIVFAFTPFRLDQMSQLPYLFTVWLPLLLEALVLFTRQTSWKRAAWLGFAFFMMGLTSLTWFALCLVPTGLAAAILITRYYLWRKREFWLRATFAIGIACFALLPFMIPYAIVARTYGFTRSVQEVKDNSASPIHWLSAHPRNQFWSRVPFSIPGNPRFRLFPGLLPLFLSAAAVAMGSKYLDQHYSRRTNALSLSKQRWVKRLDVLIVVASALSILALGFEGTSAMAGLFNYVKSEFALTALLSAVIARFCLSYPAFMRAKNANLTQTLRGPRSEAFWLGTMLTAVGFCYSLGWNFFFYRICYDLIPLFRGMRMPTRGAMFACLGLALLAGLGAKHLAEFVSGRWPRLSRRILAVAVCVLLLFELNAAPLAIMRGDLLPDAVTLRLKETPMRGGVVILPAGGGYNHHHMLRAADHARPLITATSGFAPPYEVEIENFTNSGPISSGFLNLLEKIPASYVVVLSHLIRPERQAIYESFLAHAVASGRLRFVNRFDAHDDLYAVVKTEPQAKSEAPLPFEAPRREWSAAIEEEPLNLLSHSLEWTRDVYGMYLAAFGRMPRFEEVIRDMKVVAKGVIMGDAETDPPLNERLLRLARSWEENPAYKTNFGQLSDDEFVTRLLSNANLQIPEHERGWLVSTLADGSKTRSEMLVLLGTDSRLMQKEQDRSLVLLYFFAYLRRNPDDPPDNNLNGFQHWLYHLQKHGAGELTTAFASSIERAKLLERKHP